MLDNVYIDGKVVTRGSGVDPAAVVMTTTTTGAPLATMATAAVTTTRWVLPPADAGRR